MNWPAQCAVIIPCLNESAAIATLVPAVRRHLPKVIVIDDGSQDDTARLAAGAGAEVLRHEHPRGKGAALQTGLKRASETSCRWALTMDGDGQHSPNDIEKFLKCAEVTGAELVIGNRMNHADGMPWLRRSVNCWMSRRISRRAGREFPDTQCGFRLIDLTAWSALVITTSHFEIESEILLAFAQARRKIEFVPIQVIYKNEQSKIHPLRDAIRWFRWWHSAG